MSRSAQLSSTSPRGLILAAGGCAAAAAALLLASGQAWLQVSLPAAPPLPGVSAALTGQEVVEVLAPIGFLVGAAGLALIASRRLGRLIVGAILVMAGLLAMSVIIFFLDDGGSLAAFSWAQGRSAIGESANPDRRLLVPPAVLALSGGAIAVAVGVLAIARSRRWPTMGARYERRNRPPAERNGGRTPAGLSAPANHAAPAASEAAIWTALDRGEDPTATPSPSA